MGISLNVLGLPAVDEATLIAWVKKARPAHVLVMDNVELGMRLASTGTTIVFRRFHPSDSSFHEWLSPQQWLSSVDDLPRGWIIQALNEPGGDQRQLSDWCSELMVSAHQVGRRVAVPNWSVGNPNEQFVDSGVYDRMLRTLVTYPEHLLAVHEYFITSPLAEPWHIGRYRRLHARAQRIGLRPPVTIVTEHGRDVSGGHDGWRTVFSEREYAKKLEEAQSIYRANGVDALVFCYGDGFDQRWRTYNVEGATVLLEEMANMAYYGPPGWSQAVPTPPATVVNVRSAPNITAPVVSQLKKGSWAQLGSTVIKATGYTWRQLKTEKCVEGWVATEVISFT